MNALGNDVHWNRVYREKRDVQTSWHRAHLDVSLNLIDGLVLADDDAIIDVGAGRSTLVDDLLARGHRDVTVLDIAREALDETRRRVGADGAGIGWIEGDVTALDLPVARYALWHDRAVFHFLVDDGDRARYAAAMARAVRGGGYALVATFAPHGPERCSGLPVCRYDAAALAAAFAPAFEPCAHVEDLHHTPWGDAQAFTHVLLRRLDTGESKEQRC